MSRNLVFASLLGWALATGSLRADDPAELTGDEIQRTLSAAAESIRQGPFGPGAILTRDYLPLNVNRERIEAALEREVDLEFIDTGLNQVVQYLMERYQIPMVVDDSRLTRLGIVVDTPTSLVISGISLRSALGLMLDPLQLDVVIQHDVLMLTTREHADELLEVRVYELRRAPPEYTSENLARVIQQTIRPDDWRTQQGIHSRGPGSASEVEDGLPAMNATPRPVPLGRPATTQAETAASPPRRGSIEALPGCLVVTHSQRTHREIAAFLEQFERFVANDPRQPETDAAAAAPPLELLQAARQIVRLDAARIDLEGQLDHERQRAQSQLRAKQISLEQVAARAEAESERQQRTIQLLQAELERLKAELEQAAKPADN